MQGAVAVSVNDRGQPITLVTVTARWDDLYLAIESIEQTCHEYHSGDCDCREVQARLSDALAAAVNGTSAT